MNRRSEMIGYSIHISSWRYIIMTIETTSGILFDTDAGVPNYWPFKLVNKALHDDTAYLNVNIHGVFELYGAEYLK